MMHFFTWGGIAVYCLLHYIHRNLFYTVVSTMTALLCIHSVAYLFFGGWLLGFMYLILHFSELSLTAGLHSSLRADL